MEQQKTNKTAVLKELKKKTKYIHNLLKRSFTDNIDRIIHYNSGDGLKTWIMSNAAIDNDFISHYPFNKEKEDHNQKMRALLFRLNHQEKIVNQLLKENKSLKRKLLQEQLRPPEKGGSEFEKAQKRNLNKMKA